jgi:ATP/maltotriose-dependent transcriptional regulator MalT
MSHDTRRTIEGVTSSSPHDPGSLVEPLNERERDVLRLIAQGLSNRDIADRQVVALSTVKWYVNNI